MEKSFKTYEVQDTYILDRLIFSQSTLIKEKIIKCKTIGKYTNKMLLSIINVTLLMCVKKVINVLKYK